MTDKNLTNNEIIKTLEGAILNAKGCDSKVWSIEIYKLENALDLINRLQAENKRLGKEVNLVSIQFQDLQEETDEIKSKAYKEFAEKLKKKCYEDFEESDEMLAPYVTEDNIDEVLKEMAGE